MKVSLKCFSGSPVSLGGFELITFQSLEHNLKNLPTASFYFIITNPFYCHLLMTTIIMPMASYDAQVLMVLLKPRRWIATVKKFHFYCSKMLESQMVSFDFTMQTILWCVSCPFIHPFIHYLYRLLVRAMGNLEPEIFGFRHAGQSFLGVQT